MVIGDILDRNLWGFASRVALGSRGKTLTFKELGERSFIVVPDPAWGEAVKACVVLKEGHEATEEEIITLCKKNLAHYKAPKSVDFLNDLPVTPTGKIRKWELRERYGRKTLM